MMFELITAWCLGTASVPDLDCMVLAAQAYAQQGQWMRILQLVLAAEAMNSERVQTDSWDELVEIACDA